MHGIQFHDHATEAGVVADVLRNTFEPTKVDVALDGIETQVLVLPDGLGGLKAHSIKPFIDENRSAPERRTGTAKLLDLDSFINLTKRFKHEASAIFAIDHGENLSLTTVFDYHPEGSDVGVADFGNHRAIYSFPFSEEWIAWRKAEAAPLDQRDFAEFLEERIIDVLTPPGFLDPQSEEVPKSDSDRALRDLTFKIGGRFAGPEKLMQLSRGLKFNEESKLSNIQNPATGEASLRFETTHKDEDGKPLTVPNLFLIQIPVFQNGPAYRLPVRLRYRKAGGSLMWYLLRHRADLAVMDAVNEACDKAAKDTGLPLYRGTPEPAISRRQSGAG